MSDAMERTTAKIYQFPEGGRRPRTLRSATSLSAEIATPARGVRMVQGANWYHEEAIRDADLTRER